jgi:hypothetical protein
LFPIDSSLATFICAGSVGDQSRWISGNGFELRDKNLELIAKTFGKMGERLEAEAAAASPGTGGLTGQVREKLK